MSQEKATDIKGLNHLLYSLFSQITPGVEKTFANSKLAEILSLANKHARDIQPSTYALLFSQLGLLKKSHQVYAEELIFFCIEKFECFDPKKKFTPAQLSQILNALPKLPVNWENFSNLTGILVSKIQIALKKKPAEFNPRELIAILGALAKLNFPGKKPLKLISTILKALDPFNKNLLEWDSSSLSEFWQFCVYANFKFKKSKLAKLLSVTEEALNKTTREPHLPSKAHISIAELLKNILLKSEYTEMLKMEHIVGAYSLDIALIELKLNIEIDGEHHYRPGGRLIRNHKFRDFILKEHGQWAVIRISLEEYNALHSKQERLNYLAAKLKESGFEHILQPRSPALAMASQGLMKIPHENNNSTIVSTSSDESPRKNGPL